MTHRQVVLPELGFSVDEGLEDLVRACWRRGIATAASCIGGVYRDDAEILFSDMYAGWRWEDVTGRDCDWVCETPAAAYFPAADIPELVEVLDVVDESELVERAGAYNAMADVDDVVKVADLGPFHNEVRRRRVEWEAIR
jgi:hypothetical protein